VGFGNMAERLPVLVVDDNDFIRNSIVLFLKGQGYEIIAVPSAQKAMDALRERPMGLVISDIIMPETTGTDLIEFIRGYNEPVQSTPIIAISGGNKNVDDDNIFEPIIEKVDLVLKKPFSKETLLEQIKKLIRKSAKENKKEAEFYIEE